jgi:endonuclease YncB( thermonuclease family)
MTRDLWILALCCCLLAPGAALPAPETFRGKARALDGDSLRVGRREVRLWGIDAPEYGQSCDRAGRPWDCGQAARAALASRVDGRTLVCEVRDRDAYRRAVSVCRVDGARSVNEWMVREGWALDYRRYSRGAFADAERQARQAERGLWSGRFERPERYRQRHRPR